MIHQLLAFSGQSVAGTVGLVKLAVTSVLLLLHLPSLLLSSLFLSSLFLPSLPSTTACVMPKSFEGVWKYSFDPKIKITIRNLDIIASNTSDDSPWRIKLVPGRLLGFRCSESGAIELRLWLKPTLRMCLMLGRLLGFSHSLRIDAAAVLQRVPDVASDVSAEMMICPSDQLHTPESAPEVDMFRFYLVKVELDPYRFKEVGCFRPVTLPGRLPVYQLARLHPRHCAQHCGVQRFPFFAMKANRCQCRPLFNVTLQSQSEYSADEFELPEMCNFKCPRYRKKKTTLNCGGNRTWTVFVITDGMSPVSRFDSRGCFAFPANFVANSSRRSASSSNMSVSGCQSFCHLSGHSDIMLTSGNRCSCIPFFWHFGKVNDSLCSHSCLDGHPCGGDEDGSVYSVGPVMKELRDRFVPESLVGEWTEIFTGRRFVLHRTGYQVLGVAGDPFRDPFQFPERVLPAFEIQHFSQRMLRLKATLGCYEDAAMFQCLSIVAANDNLTAALYVVNTNTSIDGWDALDCEDRSDKDEQGLSRRFFELLLVSPSLEPFSLHDLVADVAASFPLAQTYAALKPDLQPFVAENANAALEFLGCFRFDLHHGEHILDVWSNWTVTLRDCAAFCYYKDYDVVGLHSGQFCTCSLLGRLNGAVTKTDVRKCGWRRTCDDYESCLGVPRHEDNSQELEVGMYRILRRSDLSELSRLRVPETFVECRQTQAEVLDELEASRVEGLTSKMCVERCRISGLSFAGVQRGLVCACSDELDAFGRRATGDSACSDTCFDGWGEYCGAVDTFAVYRVKEKGFPPPEIPRPTKVFQEMFVAGIEKCPVGETSNSTIFLSEFGAGGHDNEENEAGRLRISLSMIFVSAVVVAVISQELLCPPIRI